MLEEQSDSLAEDSLLTKSESDIGKSTKIDDKRTKRQKLLKLELTGDVKNQLTAVQKKLYKIEVPPIALAKPSRLPTKWRTTDELLFAQARNSYDTILKAFMKDPKVYKFESIKQKVWSRSLAEREGRPWEEDEDGDDRSFASSASRSSKGSYRSMRSRKRSSATDLLESPRDTDVKTFIDPFIQGDMEEIWKEKLHMLEKLTPRADLNGYEYREDYDEQQYRISLMNDFQDRLKIEIYRRTFEPTFTEQIEDCLFQMVEQVCTEIDNRTYRAKLKKKAKLKQVRHPSMGAYRVKALEKKIGEEGQVVQALTDLDFLEVTITKGGYVLSPTIPLKVLLIHDHEREVHAEMKRREAEERENIRRLPLTKKLRIAVLSNADMQSLVRHIARDIVDSAVVLPSQPYREKLNRVLKTALRGVTELSKDPNKALDLIRDRMSHNFDRFISLVKTKKKKDNILIDTSMDDILNDAKKLKADEEGGKLKSLSQKLREEERNINTKIPVSLPDSILIKLTLKYEPPSAYKIRAKRTFNSEIEKLAERAKVTMDENKILAMENYEQIIKKGQDVALQEFLKEAKEQIQEKKKEMYLAENIPVRKLVGSQFYHGYLRPEDLVLKPKENRKGEIQMVYDDSERKTFEEAFLDEISYAACIPRANITIEQIRRLEVNSTRLKECIEMKQKKIEEHMLRHKEEQFKLALKRFIRKAESKGIALNEDIIYALDYAPEKIEEKFLLFPEINNIFEGKHSDEILPLLLDLPSTSQQSSSSLQPSIKRDEDLTSLQSSVKRDEDLTDQRSTASTIDQQNIPPVKKDDGLKSDQEVVKEVLDRLIAAIERSLSDQPEVSHNDVDLTEKLSIPTVIPVNDPVEQKMDDQSTSVQSQTEKTVETVKEGTEEPSGTDIVFFEKSGNEIIRRDDLALKTLDEVQSEKKEEDEEEEENEYILPAEQVSPFPDRIGIATAESPKYFKLGLPNPDDMKHDPSYWFSQYLHEMDDERKSNYRIQKLPALRDYYLNLSGANRGGQKEGVGGNYYSIMMKKKINELKTYKQDLQDDIIEYLDPLMEKLEPILEKLKPYYLKYKEKIANFLYFVFYQMKFMVRKQLEILYKNQQFKDVLQNALLQQQSMKKKEGEEEGGGLNEADVKLLKDQENSEDASSVSTIVHPPEVIDLMREMLLEVVQRDIEAKRGLAQNPFAFDPQSVLTPTTEKPKDEEIPVSDKVSSKPDHMKVIPFQMRNSSVKNIQHETIAEEGSQSIISGSQSNSLEKTLDGEGGDQASFGEDDDLTADPDGDPEENEDGEDENGEDEDENEVAEEDEVAEEEQEEEEQEELEEAEEIPEEEVEQLEESIDGEPINEEEQDLLKADENLEENEITKDNETEKNEVAESQKTSDAPQRLSLLSLKRPTSATKRRPRSASSYRSDESEDNSKNEKTKHLRRNRSERYTYLSNPSADPSTVLKKEVKQPPAVVPIGIDESNPASANESRQSSRPVSRPSSAIARPTTTVSTTEPPATASNPPNPSNPETEIEPVSTPVPTVPVAVTEVESTPVPAITLSFDDIFWQRVDSLDLYSEEVITVVRNLCIRVEENLTYDEANDNRLFGCEITLNVIIRDEQRQLVPGLDDLCSKDIAHYLSKQLYDPSSELNQGEITKHIVNVDMTPIYEKYDYFEEWNSYWIHILHPIFFYYSVLSKDIDLEILQQKNHQFQNILYSDKMSYKKEKQDKLSSELLLLPSDHPASSVHSSAARRSAPSSILPTGMKIVNPVQQFDERTKEAFSAAMNRPTLLPPGFRVKKTADNPNGAVEDVELPPDMRQLNIDPQILDLHVDEFQKQMKTSGVLSLYRPNMEEVTEKDVSRCLRVYQAAKDLYEDAMKLGLEKNALRPQQYSSLKFMQHSLRIYLTAKQKLEQSKRREVMRGLREKDPFSLPLFEPTKIDEDIFELWIEEVRENDKQRLANRQVQAEKLKLLLKQEALLRRKAQKLKYWIMEAFIRYYLQHKPNILPKDHANHRNNQHNHSVSTSIRTTTVLAPTVITGRAIATPMATHSMSIDTADDESVKSALSNATDATNVSPITLLPDDYLTRMHKIYQYYCDYYEYHHDLLELQTALRLELEKKEEMIRLLQQGKHGITNPDIIHQFDHEQEKNIEMKKMMISEEKKMRRLFALLVQWKKQDKFNPDKSNDMMENTLGGGKLLLEAGNVLSPPVTSPTTPGMQGRKVASPKNNHANAVVTIDPSTTEKSHESHRPSTSEPPSMKSLEFTTDKEEFVEQDTWRLIDYLLDQFVSPPDTAATQPDGRHRTSTGHAIANETIPKEFLFQFLNHVFDFIDQEKQLSASYSISKSRDPNSAAPRQLLLPPPPAPASPRTAGAVVTKVISELDEDDELNGIKILHRSDVFTDTEWTFIKDIRWIQAVQLHPPFSDCLFYFPTLEDGLYQRDELVQFASILVDLSPLFNNIITTLNDRKFQAEVKLGINKIREKQKNQKKERKKRRGKGGGGGDELNAAMTEEEKQRLHEEDRLKKVKEQEEYQQHLLQIQKQMEREKAWFMSHPHKYLLPRNHDAYLYFTYSFYLNLWKEKQEKNLKNNFTSKFDQKDTSPPFCIVCKQRGYEYWVKLYHEMENDYQKFYQDKIMNPQLNRLEASLLTQIEEEMKTVLQQEAKEIVEKQLIAEGLLPAPPKVKKTKEKLPALMEEGEGEGEGEGDGEANSQGESKKKENHEEDSNSIVTSGTDQKSNATEEEDIKEKKKMFEYFKRLQAPLINCEGQNIIEAYLLKRVQFREQEKQRKLKKLLAKRKQKKSEKYSKKNPSIEDKKEQVEGGDDAPGGDENPTLVISDVKMGFGLEVMNPMEYGIKIRVFHRNEQGQKAKFLGMIEINDKIMRKPPKGIRTYRLQPDPNIADENEVDITGTLAVMVNLISTAKLKKLRSDYSSDEGEGEGKNRGGGGFGPVIYEELEDGEEEELDHRRYEIITKYYWKLQVKRLTKVTSMDSSRLSNPFCEIFYKGMVELPANPQQQFVDDGETEEEKDEEDERKAVKKRTLALGGEDDDDVADVEAEENEHDVGDEHALALVPTKKNKKKQKKKKSKEKKIIKFLPDYTYIGSTKTNYRTIEFEYNEKENHDYSYYDLPPVYTPMIIPSADQANHQSSSAAMSPAAMASLRIGGYVSKHLLHEIKQFHKSYQKKQLEHQQKMKGGKGNDALNLLGGDSNEGGGGDSGSMVSMIQQQREFQKFQELIFIELRFQLEISKIIILNEEDERKKMANEEYELRSILNTNLFSYYDSDILIQNYYAQHFQKLLENIVQPSSMLQRLRFLMGEVEHAHHYYLSSQYQTPHYTPMTFIAAREAGYSNILQIGTDEYTQSLATLAEGEAVVGDVSKKSSNKIALELQQSLVGSGRGGSEGKTSLKPNLKKGSDALEDGSLITDVDGNEGDHMFSMSATLGLASQESLLNVQTNELIRAINPPPTMQNQNFGTGSDLANISMREYMFRRFKQGKQGEGEGKEKDKLITSHLSANEATYDQIHNSIHQTEKKKKQQSLASNSSMIIRCEDPSTHSIVHVIIIPIQSRSEEYYLKEQLLKLIGKYTYYLMKIIDFSVHEVSIYNAQGFNTVREKVGIIIKEYYHQTMTLYDYLLKSWDTITNDEFREFLLQCVLAMKELHTEEIIHQNLTPNCFMIVYPNQNNTTDNLTPQQQTAIVSKNKAKVIQKPMVKLDYYYILENPRNPKDSHRDLGRSDFGNFYTTPPETFQALNQINEKMDVFSFGVCVYYFASKGQLLPFNPYTLLASQSSSGPASQQYYYYQQEIEKCYSNVSLKWGTWLINLLRMCLTFSPNHRATVQELQLYLGKRIGREKMKR